MNKIINKTLVFLVLSALTAVGFLSYSFAATTKATSTKAATSKTATKVVTKTVTQTPKLPAIKSYTVAAWVPYWREASGTAEIIKNINKVDIVSPFAYEMTSTGTFVDKMKLGSGPYADMVKALKDKKKLVIPSILWYPSTETGRNEVDFVLKDADLRSAIIYDINAEIKKYNLDGIDIDFENKKAETRDAFSTFLEELSKSLHKNGKLLVCTIEARTPSDTDFVNGPSAEKDLMRSNDFKRIGKACDQVRIMAYDQGGADTDLNKIQTGAYRPVADIDWVKKVLTLAMRDIEWKKIIVGVPTYGYKYEITRDQKGEINSYKRIGSMNYYYADIEAKERGIVPTRHKSGEVYYTYIDEANNKEYLIWYSDAESIKQKQDLAKLYKIGGVAIFKIDGNNDKNIWSKI